MRFYNCSLWNSIFYFHPFSSAFSRFNPVKTGWRQKILLTGRIANPVVVKKHNISRCLLHRHSIPILSNFRQKIKPPPVQCPNRGSTPVICHNGGTFVYWMPWAHLMTAIKRQKLECFSGINKFPSFSAIDSFKKLRHPNLGHSINFTFMPLSLSDMEHLFKWHNKYPIQKTLMSLTSDEFVTIRNSCPCLLENSFPCLLEMRYVWHDMRWDKMRWALYNFR